MLSGTASSPSRGRKIHFNILLMMMLLLLLLLLGLIMSVDDKRLIRHANHKASRRGNCRVLPRQYR